MAAELETKKPSPEAFVERKLAEVCRRIRLLDLGAAALLLAAVVCLYALAAGVFDLLTEGTDAVWPTVVRWVGFGLFVLLAGLLTVRLVVRAFRRINPYYAARQLEQTVPDAKNSLINWLDLKEEPLPASFRKNLSNRAVHDLKEADPERVLDRRPTWWLTGLFAVALLGLLVLLAARPGPFFALMRRAFLPFVESRLAEQTRITLLRPEGGNAVVPEHQAVTFLAQIDGRVPEVNQPGAPGLHFRYQPGDAFVTLPLRQDANGQWFGRLLADQVRNTGVWYKLTAGNAETPEYQISVRPRPHARRFEITYRHRPYLNVPEETVAFPNQHASVPYLKAHPGAAVTLVVRASQPVRRATVEVADEKRKQALPAEMLPDDPTAFRVQWTLQRPGRFRIAFTTADGEENVDRRTYEIDVLQDGPPTVLLARPGEDVQLPADGTLELEGRADDDLGIKALALKLRLLDGQKTLDLQAKPYRPGKSFDRDGRYPTALDYRDFLALDQLRDAYDRPVPVRAGNVVEYWLEATDNSDYPDPAGQVGKSKTYKVIILDPRPDEKQRQQERKSAQDRQKQHEKRQDDQLSQPQQGNDGQGAEQARQEAEKLAKDLQEQLDRHQPPQPGTAKGQEPDKAEAKSGQQDSPQPGQKDQQPPMPDKDGKSEPKQQPGQAKDAGSQEKQPNEKKGDAPQPTAKDGNGPKDKDQGKDGGTGADKSGTAKGDEKKSSGPDAQAKGQESGDGTPQAQAKEANAESPGQAKEKQADGQKSQAKDAGSGDPPSTRAKNGEGQGVQEKQVPGAQAKQPPTQASDPTGFAKGDGDAFNKDKTRPPTPEEVAHLKDLAQRKDGIGDMAAKALTQIAQQSPDPQTREQAREALAEAGREMGPEAKGAENPSGPPVGQGKGDSDQPPGPEKVKQKTAGTDAKGGTGPRDATNPDPANAEFARQGGNLQLEDFLRRATPEYRQKAGISAADWQELLRKAARYNELLSKLPRMKGRGEYERGGRGQLPGVAPRAVVGNREGGDEPLDAGRAETPPELLDAQRRFRRAGER